MSITKDVRQLPSSYAQKIDEIDLIKEFDIPDINKDLGDRINEFFMRGGKRLRPTLMFSAIKTYAPDRVDDGLWAGVSLELDHNFFLVHDDIQDRAFTRRGGPTLHIAYGTGKAVNYGDYMMMMAGMALDKGMNIWGTETHSRLVMARNEMMKATAEGQDLEMELRDMPMETHMTEENVLKILRRKTGFYTAFNPTRYGAIIAGLDDHEIDKCKEAWINVGVSFQITDDVLDLTGEMELFGKDWLGDLEEGKRTYPLTLAFQMADKKDKKRFLEIMDVDGKMHGLVHKRDELLRQDKRTGDREYDMLQKEIDGYKGEILEIMEKYGAIEASKEKGLYFLDLGMGVLQDRLPESEGKDELLMLVEYLSLREY